MKKKLLVLVIAIVSVATVCTFAFTACDSGNIETNNNQNTEQNNNNKDDNNQNNNTNDDNKTPDNDNNDNNDDTTDNDDTTNNDDTNNNGNLYVTETTIDGKLSYVFTASSDVMTITYMTSVEDYLNALKKMGEIDFDGYTSDFGYFIASVNGKAGEVISSTANSYEGYDWAFYIDFTELEDDDGIYGSEWSTYEYEGKTLYSASYGVSYVPCVEGHTYALIYNYSNMTW